MIGFNPPRTTNDIVSRLSDAVGKSLALAQSAQDLAVAIAAIFRSSQPGGQTLTLGTTAPDGILTTTPTRWVVIIESDGLPTTIAGWR